jgi:hypothetical protein
VAKIHEIDLAFRKINYREQEMSIRKSLYYLAFSILILFAFSWQGAKAQNICNIEAGRADQAIREQFQQSIDYFLRLAAAARSKGIDPRNFPQVDYQGNVDVIDFIQIITNLSNQRDQGIRNIFAAYNACVSGIAPYQSIIDTATFYLSGGINQVVPHKALYIDASNLLAGTPFGGQNALIPQAREQILSMLGIGGTTADFIRNPLQITQGGPVRLPWNPIFGPIGGLPISPIPSIPPLGNVLALPSLPSPKPIEVGKVAGHRVCLPWC